MSLAGTIGIGYDWVRTKWFATVRNGFEMVKRSKIKDYEALERDYRAGTMTGVQIGDKHGVSEAYVRKVAKKRGWRRDLGDKVRARIREKAFLDDLKPQDEGQVIEEAAESGVRLVRTHKQNLLDLRAATAKLATKLAAEIDRTPNIMTLAGPINQLARSLGQLLPLERQAHGLDAPAAERSQQDPLDEMSEVELRAYIKGCNS